MQFKISDRDIIASHKFNDILDAVIYFGSYEKFNEFRKNMKDRLQYTVNLFKDIGIFETDNDSYTGVSFNQNIEDDINCSDDGWQDYMSYLESLTNEEIKDIIAHIKDINYIVNVYVMDNDKSCKSGEGYLNYLYYSDITCNKLLSMISQDKIRKINNKQILLENSKIMITSKKQLDQKYLQSCKYKIEVMSERDDYSAMFLSIVLK